MHSYKSLLKESSCFDRAQFEDSRLFYFILFLLSFPLIPLTLHLSPMCTNQAGFLGKSPFRRVWIASVLVLEYQLGNIIKGNQGDSSADKEIVKNLFRIRNSKLSNANASCSSEQQQSPHLLFSEDWKNRTKALQLEGVKESLSSAQHFGRNNTEFASVWVATSKSLRK